MGIEDKDAVTLAVISKQLTMMHDSVNTNFQNIRDDIRRMDEKHREDMADLETRMGKRIDSTNERLKVVETQQQSNSNSIVRNTTITAGIAALLTMTFTEIIKRIH